MTVYVDQYFLTLFGMKTNFQNTQTSVAHRLRTTGLNCSVKMVFSGKKHDVLQKISLFIKNAENKLFSNRSKTENFSSFGRQQFH